MRRESTPTTKLQVGYSVIAAILLNYITIGLFTMILIEGDQPQLLVTCLVLNSLCCIYYIIRLRKPLPHSRKMTYEQSQFIRVQNTLPYICLFLISILGIRLTDNDIPALGSMLSIAVYTGIPIASAGVVSHVLSKYRHDFYMTHCHNCLYDLTSVESSTCPECNTPITHPAEAAS